MGEEQANRCVDLVPGVVWWLISGGRAGALGRCRGVPMGWAIGRRPGPGNGRPKMLDGALETAFGDQQWGMREGGGAGETGLWVAVVRDKELSSLRVIR